MSRTPETITIKWRKFIHDIFCGIAGLSGLVALGGFLAEQSFVPALLICIVSFVIACNIKYEYEKKFEIGGYR